MFFIVCVSDLKNAAAHGSGCVCPSELSLSCLKQATNAIKEMSERWVYYDAHLNREALTGATTHTVRSGAWRTRERIPPLQLPRRLRVRNGQPQRGLHDLLRLGISSALSFSQAPPTSSCHRFLASKLRPKRGDFLDEVRATPPIQSMSAACSRSDPALTDPIAPSLLPLFTPAVAGGR